MRISKPIPLDDENTSVRTVTFQAIEKPKRTPVKMYGARCGITISRLRRTTPTPNDFAMSIRSLGSALIPSATFTLMRANVVRTIAISGPHGRLPKMIAVMRAQMRPGVVTPTVTASRKKPLSQRFCMRMPIAVPTTKAIANPIPILVSVSAKAPGTSPDAHSSPNVRKTSTGPGSSRSLISRPEANSHKPRKKA